MYSKFCPPFSKNNSLASTFSSSSVSRQSDINPGATTAIFFIPPLARSIIVLSVYGCNQGSGPNLD